MKFQLVTLMIVLGVAVGEPAFRRPLAQQAQPDHQDADDAPYAATGWKPSGQRLELPSRQYGPAHGPAPAQGSEEVDATTETPTETPSTPTARGQAKQQQQQQQQQDAYMGQYYVVLPDGRLQRVQFAARLEVAPGSAAPQDSPRDAQEDDEQEAREQDRPSGVAAVTRSNRPVPRPAPRPAPRPQPQTALPAASTAAALRQGKFFVVLPDGSLQEVVFAAKLEAGETEEEAMSAAGVRPQSSPRRPQPQQQQPTASQDGVPSSFVAELRFMEVPPVTGPVFSYPGPLVRV